MNRAAFSTLALGYLEEVTAFAHHLTQTRWEAEDLVQATYEKAFARWKTLRQPRQCRAWLFQIARHLLIDGHRARQARPELRLLPGDALHDNAVSLDARDVEQLDARLLRKALERLPPDQQEAIVLCDLWGFTYEEIAQITQVPKGTVRSRLSRGREALMVEVCRIQGAAAPTGSGGKP